MSSHISVTGALFVTQNSLGTTKNSLHASVLVDFFPAGKKSFSHLSLDSPLPPPSPPSQTSGQRSTSQVSEIAVIYIIYVVGVRALLLGLFRWNWRWWLLHEMKNQMFNKILRLSFFFFSKHDKRRNFAWFLPLNHSRSPCFLLVSGLNISDFFNFYPVRESCGLPRAGDLCSPYAQSALILLAFSVFLDSPPSLKIIAGWKPARGIHAAHFWNLLSFLIRHMIISGNPPVL